MRRVELIYSIVITALIVYHTLFSMPFIVETSDVLLSSNAWVILIPIITTIVVVALRQVRFIRYFYTSFHVVSMLASILSIIPILSFIPHLVAVIVGVRAWADQFSLVRELFFKYDVRQNRMNTFEKYGRERVDEEAVIKEHEKEMAEVEEFIQRDAEENQEEYQGFEERLRMNRVSIEEMQRRASELEVKINKEEAYDTTEKELEQLAYMVGVGGRDVFYQLEAPIQEAIKERYPNIMPSSNPRRQSGVSFNEIEDDPVKSFVKELRGQDNRYEPEVSSMHFNEDDYEEGYEESEQIEEGVITHGELPDDLYEDWLDTSLDDLGEDIDLDIGLDDL